MWPVKIISEMTYYVLSGTLNPTHSLVLTVIPILLLRPATTPLLLVIPPAINTVTKHFNSHHSPIRLQADDPVDPLSLQRSVSLFDDMIEDLTLSPLIQLRLNTLCHTGLTRHF